jgi:beta-aspartyl-peptidase (threonine type)
MLAGGASSLDTVEAVVRRLEDDPLFNAGRGAVYTSAGTHELDASIMNGADLACGAVASVRTVQNPVSLARRVMESTPHVLLVGAGAEEFARAQGIPVVPQSYFSTPARWEQWQRVRQQPAAVHPGTVGAVALDRRGNLAAATSTGGLTNKRWGRVGDSALIGAGTYADDRSCAVSATGKGEEFIRRGAARTVSLLVELEQLPVGRAVARVVHEMLRPGDGGLIAVSPRGEIALDHSTPGMFRGAADSRGRFQVFIWQAAEPCAACQPSAARPAVQP